jgi:predicted Zn-dependent protease
MLLSDEDEVRMGQETDPEITAMYGIYDDVALVTYIDNLGQQLAKISHRPQLTYTFNVMDSPVINAFAVPGGYVYLTRGILAYLNSEAELAGIIGHEIGHITARHSAQQYTKAQLAQIGLGLGSLLSQTFSQYAGLAGQGVGLLFLKFSRDNEREADSLGVEYSSKAGYDATDMANFFITLDKMHGGEKGSLPDFLTTHPNPENRVGAVREAARKWQATLGLTSPTINRNTYLRRIDGLVVGDDPMQGFVENSIFYHPGMKFTFPVPRGWELQNLPSQVQIISPDEKASILFTLGTTTKIISPDEKASILFTLGTTTTPEAEAQNFLAASKATVLSRKDTVINGFKTLMLMSQLPTQSGTLQIVSSFISNNRTVFIFHGFTGELNFTAYQTAFQGTMNGFRTLGDQTKLNVRQDRIRIRQTTRTMSLSQALTQFGTATADLEKLALINGRNLSDQIPANTLLKVIEKGR